MILFHLHFVSEFRVNNEAQTDTLTAHTRRAHSTTGTEHHITWTERAISSHCERAIVCSLAVRKRFFIERRHLVLNVIELETD